MPNLSDGLKSLLILCLGAIAAVAWVGRDRPLPAAGPAPVVEAQAARPNVLQEIGSAVEVIAARAQRSVVKVTATRTRLQPPAPPTTQTLVSSGVVWAPGQIVTLGSAFEGAEAVEVAFASGRRISARVAGTDPDTGITLLTFEAEDLPKGAFEAAVPRTSGPLQAGALVVQVGNPFGLDGSVALGQVAATGRVVKRGERALTNVLQINTPVNPGDPGSPLYDASGAVCGIVASAYERGIDTEEMVALYGRLMKLGERLFGEAPTAEAEATPPRFAGRAALGGQGIGFAIPVEEVGPIVARLAKASKTPRPWIGIQVIALDPVLKAQLDLATDQGILVVGVVEGGPGHKSGLQRHDIILDFGGEAVRDLDTFKRLIQGQTPGEAIKVSLLRAGAEQALDVTLEARR